MIQKPMSGSHAITMKGKNTVGIDYMSLSCSACDLLAEFDRVDSEGYLIDAHAHVQFYTCARLCDTVIALPLPKEPK